MQSPHKATRATELNQAISELWQAEATHSKADFNQHIVPIYTRLLKELKQLLPTKEAEQQLLKLLENTTKACHRRWDIRLPMKRPGSDYRKYEIIYTYTLITAMATDALKQHSNEQNPEKVAEKIIPEEGRARLQQDPIVWADWLGFFQKAQIGGLYALSTNAVPHQPRTTKRPYKKPTDRNKTPPPPGSGRAMLEAIKSALVQGSLSYNQPGDFIQVDEQGRTFLEHPRVLKWCAKTLALDEDVKTLKSRFSRLKVHTRTAQGQQLHYGRLHNHDRRRIGYVLENPAILWPSQVPKGRFELERS